MTDRTEAVLHDGTAIPITIHGQGRALLLPVRLARIRPRKRKPCGGGAPTLTSDQHWCTGSRKRTG